MNYRDMSDEQMLAWGAQEHAARIAGLEDRSPEGLAKAQRAAEQRRKAIGATKGQAASMVHDAGVARRRAEAEKARQS